MCSRLCCPAVAFGLLVLGVVAGCEGRTPDAERTDPPRTGSAAIPEEPGSDGETRFARPSRYRRLFVSGFSTVKALRDSLGEAAFLEVLKVNRLDYAHVRKGESLVVPDGLLMQTISGDGTATGHGAPGGRPADGRTAARDSLYCSPFPRTLPFASAVPKLVVVSIRVQALAAYAEGELIRWGPTSTGKKQTPTPVGLYHVNWKDRERASTIDEEWLLNWCVNIENLLGISLHEYALPGVPASHSCVRLAREDAEWLYGWVDQWRLSEDGSSVVRPGTPVLVFGEYAYGVRPPWKGLSEDVDAATVTREEIEAAWAASARAEENP